MAIKPATSRWHPTDDAGKPLPEVSGDVYTHSVWDNRLSSKQKVLQALSWAFFPALAVIVGLQMYYQGVSLPAPGIFLVMLAWPAIFLAIAFVLGLRATRGSIRVPPLAAFTAAHRHCGACGYRLHEVEPDHLGLAQCPECGASWHRDRWTLAGRDLRASLDARSLLTGSLGMTTDDRGVWLNAEPTWPPRWFEDAPDAGAARAIVIHGNLIRDRRTRVAAYLLPVAWLIGTWLLVWMRDPLPRDRVSETLLVGIVLGMMAIVVLYLVRRASLSWPRQRSLTLAASLCPACGKHLPAGPVAFDGCRACACGRAWNAA